MVHFLGGGRGANRQQKPVLKLQMLKMKYKKTGDNPNDPGGSSSTSVASMNSDPLPLVLLALLPSLPLTAPTLLPLTIWTLLPLPPLVLLALLPLP